MIKQNHRRLSKTYDNMGLILVRKKLCWTPKGFGNKWIPEYLKKLIVKYWNMFSCKIYGHYWVKTFKNGVLNMKKEICVV